MKSFLAALALGVCAAGAAASDAAITVIKAARLIDGRGGPPIAPAMVLVEGDRIAAVGKSLAIAPGARVVDLGRPRSCPASSTCTRT